MPERKHKRGRLSTHEIDFIKKYTGLTHPQVMADKLNRSVDVVLKCIRDHVPVEKQEAFEALKKGPVEAVRTVIRQELKESVAWKQLRQEFAADEVGYFEEQYVALKEQFLHDVLASEESQLFKAIKLDILAHRNLVQQKRVQMEIDRLESERLDFLKDNADISQLDPEAQARLLNIDTLLQTAYASKQARTTEYIRLDEQYQSIIKALKATREQRISKIESGKKSFLDLIRMLQEEEVRDREGRQMEQMKRVSQKELKRLGSVHPYADGTFDRPILSPETVFMEQEGDNEGEARARRTTLADTTAVTGTAEQGDDGSPEPETDESEKQPASEE